MTYRIPDSKYRLERARCDFRDDPLGLLCMWEGPGHTLTPAQVGCRYTIGCDPGDGITNGTWSAIEVNKHGTAEHPDEQVAEWYGCISSLQLPPLLNAIGRLYCEDDSTPALMAIEVNRHRSVQEALLKEYAYPNFYIWTVPDRMRNPYTNSYGWVTNERSRQDLCDRAVQWLRERRWRINSPWLVKQLATFEYDPLKQRMAAIVGGRDDLVMAAFIALYCSRNWSFGEDFTATIDAEAVLAEAERRNPQAMDVSSEDAEDWQTAQQVFY